MKNEEKLKAWHEQLDIMVTYLFGTDRTEKEIEEIKEAHQTLGCFLEDQICHSWLFDYNNEAVKQMINLKKE